MVRTVWCADGLRGTTFLLCLLVPLIMYSWCIANGLFFLFIVGFYRGIAPGVTGSLATGATYFGFIESTKKWIEESNPELGGTGLIF